jgi:hypothetical protein
LSEFEIVLDTGVKILNGEEDDENNVSLPRKRRVASTRYSSSGNSNHTNEAEGFQEQLKGFVKSTGELLEKLAQGCRDVVKQSLGVEDSVLVRRFGGMWAKFTPHMEVVNQFLPEDRSPAHVWSVLFFVFFLTVAGMHSFSLLVLIFKKYIYILNLYKHFVFAGISKENLETFRVNSFSKEVCLQPYLQKFCEHSPYFFICEHYFNSYYCFANLFLTE